MVIPKQISAGEFSHELGHAKNYNGYNGKRTKKIYDLGQTQDNLRNLTAIDYMRFSKFLKRNKRASMLESDGFNSEEIKKIDDFMNSSKLSDVRKRLKEGSFLIQDEKNASKWAIKNIKGKLPRKIFKLEKKRQNEANKSYKKAVQISSKLPLRNKIQIPSRRGDF